MAFYLAVPASDSMVPRLLRLLIRGQLVSWVVSLLGATSFFVLLTSVSRVFLVTKVGVFDLSALTRVA